MNPLQELRKYGQSVWLDYLRRGLLKSGELKQLIEQDSLAGVTSNPSIFEKAITGSTDYDDVLDSVRAMRGLTTAQRFERLAVPDIQAAADVLMPVFADTDRRDGYVSLEVSPHLAHDTQGTLEGVRRLWGEVDRENVMIKVPATPEGIPAIEQLTGEGININVTLIFSLAAYELVLESYLSGLEKLVSGGGNPDHVAGVASFFLSRIDSAVDTLVEKRLKHPGDRKEADMLSGLMGKVAVASAKLAYRHFRTVTNGERWKELAGHGARPQRLLWASTGTKNPAYSDVLYVEELIGPDTVTTLPPSTMRAFRDHGDVRPTLETDIAGAEEIMSQLEELDISLESVTDNLLADGVKKFETSYDRLLEKLEETCAGTGEVTGDTWSFHLPDELMVKVERTIEEWEREGNVSRVWNGDAGLWTGKDEGDWLGWLFVTEDQLDRASKLEEFAAGVKEEGFTDVLLMGMGGSSLCPDVLANSFGPLEGYPRLSIIDSTDPAQVRSVANRIDPARTLFIVASKSGTTLEPNILLDFFYDLVKGKIGEEKAGMRFVAITDPGSKLEDLAGRQGFRKVFHGVKSIGGRYSALSDFGMVPASVMGIDTKDFLERADGMRVACSSCIPIRQNPGALLGVVLGVCADEGRDKVTFVVSLDIRDLGAWLEQLLAESTGKEGKGIIPVDLEPVGPPGVYENDRLFVYVRSIRSPDAIQDQAVHTLKEKGHPVVRIDVDGAPCLGREFFRWEFATAVAGSVMGINPFDQPDVEASKVQTRQLTDEYESTGKLPAEEPFLETDGLKLFTDENNRRALDEQADGDRSLAGYLRAHFGRFLTGDYFAILAYIERSPAFEERLGSIRMLIRDRLNVATCVGFGPRFLHSTGQVYKGGPDTGVFLQITCEDGRDLEIPGQKYSFGVVKAAQARGDLRVLTDRGRRALRIHVGPDIEDGLDMIEKAVDKALS